MGSPSGERYEEALGRQHGPPSSGSTTPLETALPLNPEGVDFLQSATRRSLLTIEAANLAVRRSPQGSGRSAMAVIAQESQILSFAKDLAGRHGVSLPNGPDATGRAELARLGRLSGRAFDQAYEAALRGWQRACLKSFADAANSAHQQSEIRRFARAEIPRLQARLAQTGSAPATR